VSQVCLNAPASASRYTTVSLPEAEIDQEICSSATSILQENNGPGDVERAELGVSAVRNAGIGDVIAVGTLSRVTDSELVAFDLTAAWRFELSAEEIRPIAPSDVSGEM
jgi:hypothetical protein